MLPVNEVLSMCNDSMAATIEELDTLAKKKVFVASSIYTSYLLTFLIVRCHDSYL